MAHVHEHGYCLNLNDGTAMRSSYHVKHISSVMPARGANRVCSITQNPTVFFLGIPTRRIPRCFVDDLSLPFLPRHQSMSGRNGWGALPPHAPFVARRRPEVCR
jgi:hypothetical protein